MSSTYNLMPFGECPYCGHKWQIDDYYEYDAGKTLECPACEKTIEVVAKDIEITLTFAKSGVARPRPSGRG
ncbi:MAG: hypothetical protein PHU85_01995 [Phycisphaerae bacterium]|nr:hypothetical protein [Phycisphaerae bacterium]